MSGHHRQTIRPLDRGVARGAKGFVNLLALSVRLWDREIRGSILIDRWSITILRVFGA
jgi:hypothetical protein